MGTIAEKLTYLNTTKIKLRDSLNKFGSSILSTDTFRSYDTKLNDIYDKLPKITQSGAGLTITPVQNGLVDDFKMIGVDLEQDTTTGKNLFDKDNANIITAYIGDSYNWTFSGSAICYRINCKPNTSYTISCANSNETIFRGSVTDSEDIPTSGNNLSIYSTVRRTNNSPITVNTGANAKYVLVQLSNTQYLTSLETLQVEEGSSVTSYEPYTGGIPSPNPDYPQDIKVVEGRQTIINSGKNLFDKEHEITGYVYDSSGNLVYSPNWNTNNEFKKISNNKISLSCKATYPISFLLIEFDSNKTFIQRQQSTTTSYTFTLNNNTEYLRFCYLNNVGTHDIQLEEGSISTDYEPYHDPVDYNIDLQLANIYLAQMPNTAYKNRIYKNNGNWYFEKNVKKVILDGNENWSVRDDSNIGYLFQLKVNDIVELPNSETLGTIIANRLPTSTPSQLWTNNINGISNLNNGKYLRVRIQDSPYTTVNDFKNWLSTNNVEVWYPLATPITTQITNTTLIDQLEAISVHTGTNIITISNDNNIIPEIEITRLKELEKLA